jgi:hypothetical protein
VTVIVSVTEESDRLFQISGFDRVGAVMANAEAASQTGEHLSQLVWTVDMCPDGAHLVCHRLA